MRGLFLYSLISFLIFLGISCTHRNSKLVIENRSNSPIDSVIVSFTGKNISIGKVKANENLEQKIPGEYLRSAHDLAVNGYFIINGRKTDLPTWFTDLGANYREAHIIIGPDLKGSIELGIKDY